MNTSTSRPIVASRAGDTEPLPCGSFGAWLPPSSPLSSATAPLPIPPSHKPAITPNGTAVNIVSGRPPFSVNKIANHPFMGAFYQVAIQDDACPLRRFSSNSSLSDDDDSLDNELDMDVDWQPPSSQGSLDSFGSPLENNRICDWEAAIALQPFLPGTQLPSSGPHKPSCSPSSSLSFTLNFPAPSTCAQSSSSSPFSCDAPTTNPCFPRSPSSLPHAASAPASSLAAATAALSDPSSVPIKRTTYEGTMRGGRPRKASCWHQVVCVPAPPAAPIAAAASLAAAKLQLLSASASAPGAAVSMSQRAPAAGTCPSLHPLLVEELRQQLMARRL